MRILVFLLLVLFISCNSDKSKAPKGFDEDLFLDRVQEQTVNYFWEGAEPNSGLARERFHMDEPQLDAHIVTTGGSGFGLMAILVGIERGFIDKHEAFKRYQRIASFLESAERFHGAWPHWMDGRTGSAIPFSPKDDGGDLVETAFLVQGILAVREYYKNGSNEEQKLADRFDRLWKDVEWSWYQNGEDVLYWHWSPKHQWEMNFAVKGYNECLIMYVLAASSTTYPISSEAYHEGWARGGEIAFEGEQEGLGVVLDHYGDGKADVGPLFWAHYSYLGLNPIGLKDQYADYQKLNQNHALIHYKYCVRNPKGFAGYSEQCWGLTSSYSLQFYAGHRPGEDLGVISPTAALSSYPYTPEESAKFLQFLYSDADTLVGKYGPYDAFSIESEWFVPRYLAIDQGPIPVMIENHRSGLLWRLFMGAPEVQEGLQKLGFTSPQI